MTTFSLRVHVLLAEAINRACGKNDGNNKSVQTEGLREDENQNLVHFEKFTEVNMLTVKSFK